MISTTRGSIFDYPPQETTANTEAREERTRGVADIQLYDSMHMHTTRYHCAMERQPQKLYPVYRSVSARCRPKMRRQSSTKPWKTVWNNNKKKKKKTGRSRTLVCLFSLSGGWNVSFCLVYTDIRMTALSSCLRHQRGNVFTWNEKCGNRRSSEANAKSTQLSIYSSTPLLKIMRETISFSFSPFSTNKTFLSNWRTTSSLDGRAKSGGYDNSGQQRQQWQQWSRLSIFPHPLSPSISDSRLSSCL